MGAAEVADKLTKLNKVPGTENPADMITKNIGREGIDKCLRMMNIRRLGGRHDMAPECDV